MEQGGHQRKRTLKEKKGGGLAARHCLGGLQKVGKEKPVMWGVEREGKRLFQITNKKMVGAEQRVVGERARREKNLQLMKGQRNLKKKLKREEGVGQKRCLGKKLV